MVDLLRRSPISFEGEAAQTEVRDGWEVVLSFEGEGRGPFLIDLSHRAKWDVQSGDIGRLRPWGVGIPGSPGECIFQEGLLINRMNRTQAACWHLLGEPLRSPRGKGYTETTDALLLLVLLGREVFSIMEKACALDFQSPTVKPPCLFQAPVFHVASQVVFLGHNDGLSAVLVACARGYGYTMAGALAQAGSEWGLRPAGELAFTGWLTKWMSSSGT